MIDSTRRKWKKIMKKRRMTFRSQQEGLSDEDDDEDDDEHGTHGDDKRSQMSPNAKAEMDREKQLSMTRSILHVPYSNVLVSALPNYQPHVAEGTSVAFGSMISFESCGGMFLGTDKQAESQKAKDKNFIFKVFSADSPTQIRVIKYKEPVFLVTADMKCVIVILFCRYMYWFVKCQRQRQR